MRINIQKTIGFHQVDAHHQLRLKHLFNHLQEAAATHSHQAGYATGDLLDRGYAWVLNKVGLTVNRLPQLGETIHILTWHKGVRGLRSYRDYQILCGDEILAAATSLWVFIDVQKKKIIKPPADTGTRYTVENKDATDLDLDAWRPKKNFEPMHMASITTRPSDFDPLGHANNSAYLDYLEVALGEGAVHRRRLKKIMIQYLNEVPAGTDSVSASLSEEDDGYLFKILSKGADHVIGWAVMY